MRVPPKTIIRCQSAKSFISHRKLTVHDVFTRLSDSSTIVEGKISVHLCIFERHQTLSDTFLKKGILVFC